MSEPACQIRIGTLRVCAAGRTDPGMRLALSRLLDNADLWPAVMPPAAVLIVRRLADPLPHRLQWRSPQARPQPAWEKAAQRKLADLYAHAARPGRGSTPANVEAVRFEDEAEMLACLLVDMSRQEARQQWWWRTLLRDLPDAGAAGMTVLLQRRAAQVPAVLQRLVESGRAITVMRSFAPAQALAVVMAMAQAYAVGLPLRSAAASGPPTISTPPVTMPTLPVAVRQPPAQPHHPTPPATLPTPPAARARPAQPGHRQAPSTTPVVSAACAAPWREWLPDSLSMADLSREQACLLGVGLSLRRAPAVVRSPSFLRQLQDWWLATAEPSVQFKPPAGAVEPRFDLTDGPIAHSTTPADDSVPPSQRARLSDIPLTYSPPFQGGVARSAGLVSPGKATPPVNQSSVRKAQDAGLMEKDETGFPTPTDLTRRGEGAEQSPATGQPLPPAPAVVRPDSAPPLTADLHAAAERQSRTDPVPNSPSVAPDSAGPLQPQSRLDESATTCRLAGGVATALGGVWYLLNLMVYLDLPDCFEDDWHLATRLGAWGTLEALARALLHDSDPTLLDDPLWPALLELGERRTDEPLGADLPPDSDFRLPAAWLAGPDEPATYVWAEDGRRLRLWSTQGYLLAEVTCEPAASRATAELRRYRPDDPFILQQRRFADAPVAQFEGALTAGLSPTLERWLRLAVPAIRRRLRRALADDTEADSLDWLRQPGQLYITSTHVDLVMSLDSVSISLRLAGLDRDPGWLPDFGRIIRFHFD